MTLHQRKLPRRCKPDAAQMVTYRLAGTLPLGVARSLYDAEKRAKSLRLLQCLDLCIEHLRHRGIVAHSTFQLF
jgi:hypothetical protein